MVTLQAEFRKNCKKSANRRLRKNNKCPAIIYGKNHFNLTIELYQKDLQNPKISLHLCKNNTVSITITKYAQIILTRIKEIQFNPTKNKIHHIDFIKI